MKKIAVCATKGGVGKTTLTANLGAIIANPNRRVLLVDADPQPSLSSYYDIEKTPETTGLTSLLTTHTQPVPARTSVKNLDIIISDDPSGALENQLLHAPDGRFRMAAALDRIQGYDFALIDTRGATGALVESAALAADLCLSPVPPEIMAAQELVRGTQRMIEGLQAFSALGFKPGALHALIYRYDRTIDAIQVLENISAASELGGIHLLESKVPNRVAYREAASRRIPVHIHEPKRRSGESAKQIMEKLANEMLCKAFNSEFIISK